MEMQHWVMLAIVGFVCYVIGTKYPAFATRIGL
jgi:hypothetical protein